MDENSLLITLLGIPGKIVYDIANDVCNSFHQESVLITCTNTMVFTTVSGRITKVDRIMMYIRSLFDF